MKLISFIIPCYNSSQYMRHCIESGKVHTNFTVDDLDAYASDLYPDLDLNLLYNKEINKGVK